VLPSLRGSECLRLRGSRVRIPVPPPFSVHKGIVTNDFVSSIGLEAILTKSFGVRKIRGMETLGQLLLAWRTANDLSQEEAADRCGVPRTVWATIEQGQTAFPHPSTMDRLIEGTGYDRQRLDQACANTKVQQRSRMIPA
jgi:hypothetical protein